MKLYFSFFRFCLLAGVFFIFQKSFAGNDGFILGTRSVGSGQIGILYSDIWSVHNNIGALGWLKQGGLGVSFDNRYNLQALNQISFAGATVLEKYGTVGVGVSRFGSELFNQSKASIAWAKAFGIASIGIQGQWAQTTAVEFPTRHYLLLNFGGLAKLTSKFHFAASISNITQTKASEFKDERIPTIVRAGIAFLPNDKVKILSEVQKDLDLKSIVKVGIEYEFLKKVWVRTGFSSQIEQVSGGLGVQWRNFQLDYAIANHPQLGWTNSIGINYLIGKQIDKKVEAKKEVQ